MRATRREVLVWGHALGLFALPMPIALAADDPDGGDVGAEAGRELGGQLGAGLGGDNGTQHSGHESDPRDPEGLFGGNDPQGQQCRAPTLSGMELNPLQSLGTDTKVPPSSDSVSAGNYSDDQHDRQFMNDSPTFMDKIVDGLKEFFANAMQQGREVADYVENGVYICVGGSGANAGVGACVVLNDHSYTYQGISTAHGLEVLIGFAPGGNADKVLAGSSTSGESLIGPANLGVTATSDPGATAYTVSWPPSLPSGSITHGDYRGNVSEVTRSELQSFDNGVSEWMRDADRQLYEMSQDPFR